MGHHITDRCHFELVCSSLIKRYAIFTLLYSRLQKAERRCQFLVLHAANAIKTQKQNEKMYIYRQNIEERSKHYKQSLESFPRRVTLVKRCLIFVSLYSSSSPKSHVARGSYTQPRATCRRRLQTKI